MKSEKQNKILHSCYCVISILNNMENSLLTTARSYFNDQVFEHIATQEGASSDQVRQGLDAVIPSLFLGLQGKSSTEQSGIFDVLKQHFSQVDFSNISSLWSNASIEGGESEKSNHLLGSIFGAV